MHAGLWLLVAVLAGSGAGSGAGNGAEPDRAGRCQRGEPRTGWGGAPKCCPRCHWDRGNATPCEEAQDPDCKCPPDHGCSGDPCEFCRELPRCEPGWEPARIGTVNFRFQCQPCPSGSFSRGRRRWCRSWSDCEGSGFLTLREGNSTHNSVCSLAPAPKPAWNSLEFPCGPVLAALAAVAAFVLPLLLLLILCRTGTFPAGDLGSPRLPGEELRSIQFPEEEHGDKTAPEKLSMLSLKIPSELG